METLFIKGSIAAILLVGNALVQSVLFAVRGFCNGRASIEAGVGRTIGSLVASWFVSMFVYVSAFLLVTFPRTAERDDALVWNYTLFIIVANAVTYGAFRRVGDCFKH